METQDVTMDASTTHPSQKKKITTLFSKLACKFSRKATNFRSTEAFQVESCLLIVVSHLVQTTCPMFVP